MSGNNERSIDMTYYVTADSFGSDLQSNWETYWNGELEGAPAAEDA